MFESLRLTVCVELVSGRTEREVTYEIIPGGGSASSRSTVICIACERVVCVCVGVGVSVNVHMCLCV